MPASRAASTGRLGGFLYETADAHPDQTYLAPAREPRETAASGRADHIEIVGRRSERLGVGVRLEVGVAYALPRRCVRGSRRAAPRPTPPHRCQSPPAGKPPASTAARRCAAACRSAPRNAAPRRSPSTPPAGTGTAVTARRLSGGRAARGGAGSRPRRRTHPCRDAGCAASRVPSLTLFGALLVGTLHVQGRQ
jgi:hypothetical protein